MKKIFSVIILAAVFIFCGQNKIEASDIWLYTDKNGAEYYLRDYNLPARSWSFAHVVKISGNNVTDLAYRFEMLSDVHYSVCEGSTSYVFVSREPHPIIEQGKISERQKFGTIIFSKWKKKDGKELGNTKIEADEKF